MFQYSMKSLSPKLSNVAGQHTTLRVLRVYLGSIRTANHAMWSAPPIRIPAHAGPISSSESADVYINLLITLSDPLSSEVSTTGEEGLNALRERCQASGR